MSDPCFPVLDSEVSTEAPSSYLNQVLKFEKGKTKNLVLALGWNWDQTTRTCCLWVVAAHRQWAVNSAVSLGPDCLVDRGYASPAFSCSLLQPCAFFIPRIFFTFKLVKSRARK